MPDYLGDDQRKTKEKDNKEEDKPIKGRTNLVYLLNSIHLIFILALDEAEIALLKSYVSEYVTFILSHFVLSFV
jgi:hypothetical protein